MAERPAGWYDDEADATWLRYWDGRGWTPHTARTASTATVVAGQLSAPLQDRVAAFAPTRGDDLSALDVDDELPQPLMQTMRLVPEHTTVPTPPGGSPASPTPAATRPIDPGDRLPRGRVALIVVAALVAGTLVVSLASSVAMLLIL